MIGNFLYIVFYTSVIPFIFSSADPSFLPVLSSLSFVPSLFHRSHLFFFVSGTLLYLGCFTFTVIYFAVLLHCMEKYGFIRMLFNKGNTLYDYVTVRVYVYTCARARCVYRTRPVYDVHGAERHACTSAQARA